ncbi:MAG: hypothetical protein RLZZ618_4161 [Pseudomonadota bacterium]
MGIHVYANGHEICAKSADGRSVAQGDACWSPPPPKAGPVLVAYVNTASASQLAAGSATVFIAGGPLALRDVSYLDNSTGNEAATSAFKKGDSSHTIKGRAYFTDWSPNVKVEGLNVCRDSDPMTHNHG